MIPGILLWGRMMLEIASAYLSILVPADITSAQQKIQKPIWISLNTMIDINKAFIHSDWGCQIPIDWQMTRQNSILWTYNP